MQQDAIAMTDTAFGQRGSGGLDPVAERFPGPGGFPPDDRRTVGEPAGGLQQQRGEVGGGDQRSFSRIET
jgi:hypothetical protein